VKIIKIIFKLSLILLFLNSCGTIKKGFQNPKKNNSDEFLVQKKSPLVMPPDYGILPTPYKNKPNNDNKEKDIKDLISNKDNNQGTKNEVLDNSLEEKILEKIQKD